MVAFRKRVTVEALMNELRYWRNIRLDNPRRKAEAMRRIDEVLDELIEREAFSGADC